MWNSHPARTLKKSENFCLCSGLGEMTASAGRLRALGQSSWTQPGTHCKENSTWKSETILHEAVELWSKMPGVLFKVHSRLQLLFHFCVLILCHCCFTFTQFVHLLSWALKIRFRGWWRDLWKTEHLRKYDSETVQCAVNIEMTN